MQKLFAVLVLILGLFTTIYRANSNKIDLNELDFIKVGVESAPVMDRLGQPFRVERDSWYFKLQNKSILILTLKKDQIESAVLKFSAPQNFSVYSDEKEALVKIGEGSSTIAESHKWFFIGIPEKGKLWKVLDNGTVESISWIKPFNSKAPRKNYETLMTEIQGIKTTAQN